ncbi:MAG: hypothetical protein IKH78_09220 [Ruminococcus sp.]|nr:hypothetical protein [Ruminococcus sp.]
MKKFISAVTSLCMAASMLSVVAPAAVGAADAKKSFAVKTYDGAGSEFDSMGDKVTITKDMLAKGDVKIPCAVYYDEGTNDSEAISVQLTVDSKDISFKLYQPKEAFFSENKTFTLGGDSVKTKYAPNFASFYDDMMETYSTYGSFQGACDSSQTAAGTDNYYIGVSWTNGGKEYKWAGNKSTDFPFFVFDVTVPSSIAPGTYNIKYCDYNTDSTGQYDNPSCMVETGSRYVSKDGTLELKTMQIVVEGGEGTTTTKDVTTTTTTKQDVITTTTKSNTGNADVSFDFGGTYEAAKGDTVKVKVAIDAHNNPITALDVVFDIPSALTLKQIGTSSPAFSDHDVQTNEPTKAANFYTIDGQGEGVVPEAGATVFVIAITVPENCPDGNYTIGFTDKCKIFKDNTSWNYKTEFTAATIKVGNGGNDTTTTTKNDVVGTTTTVKQGDGQISFNFGEDVKAAKGDTVKVKVAIDAHNNPITALDVVFDIPSALTLKQIGTSSPAFNDHDVQTNEPTKAANFYTIDGQGEGVVPEAGATVFVIAITVPENCPDGTYTIGFGDKCKIFKDNTNFNYTTDFDAMNIIVGDSGNVTTTTTKNDPQPTTTTTVKQEQGQISFDFGDDVTAEKGSTVKVKVAIDAHNNPITALDVVFDIPSALTLKQIGTSSPAFNDHDVQTNEPTKAANFYTIDGQGEGVVPEAGATVFVIAITVPENCPDGTYTIGFGDKVKIFKDNTNFNYTTDFDAMNIIVGDVETTTTTVTEATTTTTKEVTTTTTVTDVQPTTTTTTGTTPVGDKYTPVWGDANCDGKVNVADVVVLNRFLNDPSNFKLTDQGKVNADVYAPQSTKAEAVAVSGVKLTAEDSEAIIKSIVDLVTLPIEK